MGGYPAIFGRIGGNLWADRGQSLGGYKSQKKRKKTHEQRVFQSFKKSGKYRRYRRYCITRCRPLEAPARLYYLFGDPEADPEIIENLRKQEKKRR